MKINSLAVASLLGVSLASVAARADLLNLRTKDRRTLTEEIGPEDVPLDPPEDDNPFDVTGDEDVVDPPVELDPAPDDADSRGGTRNLAVTTSTTTYGYPYWLRYYQAPSSLGQDGYVLVYLKSSPTGSYVNGFYFCSKGATNSVCPASFNEQYDKDALLSLYTELHKQELDAKKVVVYGGTYSSCNHNNCGVFVGFYDY